MHRRSGSGELLVLERLQRDSGVIEIQMLKPSNIQWDRIPDFRIRTQSPGGPGHVEVRTTTGAKQGQLDPVRGEKRLDPVTGEKRADLERPKYSADRVYEAFRAKIKHGQISRRRPGVIVQFVVATAEPPFLKPSMVAKLIAELANRPYIQELILIVNHKAYRVGSRKSALNLSEAPLPTGV
jgi:hypothetical protein